MAVKFLIETDSVADFESVIASLRGVTTPGEMVKMEWPAQPAADAPANMDAAPKTRKPRTPKVEDVQAAPMQADELAAVEPVVESTLEDEVVAVEETIKDEPKSDAVAPDYAKIVRDRLKAIRDKLGTPAMMEVLTLHGVNAVKDVPDAKLPAVIATCDAKLEGAA